jgi:hypothetical protein
MRQTKLRFDLLTLQLLVAVVEERNIVLTAEKKHIAVSPSVAASLAWK